VAVETPSRGDAPARSRRRAALLVLLLVLVVAATLVVRQPHRPSSTAEGADSCLTPPTAVLLAGSGPSRPVTRSVRLTVPVGQTIFVTYGGSCLKDGRLYLSKPGPGSGLDSYTGFSYWAGSPTHTWTPTEPGVRNLDVGWLCSGPFSCPLGSLGVITVTTPG
jgi:hypothetical protein